MSKTILSEEQITNIILFYRDDWTLLDLKKEFHVTVERIKKILTEHGIELRTKKESYELRDLHSKQTCQDKYGVNNVMQVPEILDKVEQTNLERYGYKCSLNNQAIKEKAVQTLKKHFGVECALASKEVQTKRRQTNLAKYGHMPGQFGTVEHNKAMLAKYGRYIISSCTNYYCDNLYFDSFPELAFYIYNRDAGAAIKREPTKLAYNYEGLTYNYVPDFDLNGQLIEIKGDQFLKEDGVWWNPYDHSKDGITEAKYQCAIKNNVKIIYVSDCAKYIEYFNSKYKKEDFRIKNIV